MSDVWHRFDFVILVCSWGSWGFSTFVNSASDSNVTSIRSIRVLKIVKSIKHLKGLQQMIRCLFISISRLVDVGFLIFFFFLVFAIVGQQLFIGSLRNRCYVGVAANTTNTGYTHVISPEYLVDQEFCSDWQSADEYFPQSVGRLCDDGDDEGFPESCSPSPTVQNPDDGFTGFDNFLLAMNTVSIIVSLEGHEEIMYNLCETTSGFAGVVFVITVVTLCSMFAVNLVLAVIFETYVGLVEGSEEMTLKRAKSRAKRLSINRRYQLSKSYTHPKSWEAGLTTTGMRRQFQAVHFCRLAAYTLITRDEWVTLVNVAIMLNFFVLASEHHGTTKLSQLLAHTPGIAHTAYRPMCRYEPRLCQEA